MTADQWLPGTGRGRLGKNRLQASTKNFYFKGEGYVHYLDCHDGFTNVYIYIYIYIYINICLNSSNLHALSVCGLKYSYIPVKLLKTFFKLGESTLQISQSL